VSWIGRTYHFAAGQEKTLRYWFAGEGEIPEWRGPQMAVPGPSMPRGGNFVATAQGSRNVGPEHDPVIEYLVTIKNRSGGAAKFTLYGGRLT
jgi:hypothetical protein